VFEGSPSILVGLVKSLSVGGRSVYDGSMSTRFLGMMGVGLILMVALWVKQASFDKAQIAADEQQSGCVKGAKCTGQGALCVAGPKLMQGVCSSPCSRRNECPENWCCTKAPESKAGVKHCLPPTLCEAP
jgi:hypothetical protein